MQSVIGAYRGGAQTNFFGRDTYTAGRQKDMDALIVGESELEGDISFYGVGMDDNEYADNILEADAET